MGKANNNAGDSIQLLSTEIEQKKEKISDVERRIAEMNRLLGALQKEQDSLETALREEFEIEREKKKLLEAVEKVADINADGFIEFFQLEKEKLRGVLQTQDIQKVKLIIKKSDQEVDKATKALKVMEREYRDKRKKEQAALAVLEEVCEDYRLALEEMKLLPDEFMQLKNNMARCKHLAEASEENEKYLEMLFFLSELERSIPGNEELLDRKDTLTCALDRKPVNEAKEEYNEIRGRFIACEQTFNAAKGELEKMKKDREVRILAMLDDISSAENRGEAKKPSAYDLTRVIPLEDTVKEDETWQRTIVIDP
ncbi:MAG: hypothetical protein GY765_07975 [bacterium]|nr:hypothetical protein [bacterium]